MIYISSVHAYPWNQTSSRSNQRLFTGLMYPTDGKCVQECPDGFYGDEDSQDCEECHSDCSSCSGPEDSDCDSCIDGLTLDNGACVSEQDVCPAQMYLTGESNTPERKNLILVHSSSDLI